MVSYIGLGANLGDREGNIRRALTLMNETPGIHVLRVSTVEETKAIGPAQPDYVNAVAAIETSLKPLDLLDSLLTIEKSLGRERRERWGPRPIDLDVLYYGNQRISHPRLTVPHPHIAEREFVLRELKEVGFNA